MKRSPRTSTSREAIAGRCCDFGCSDYVAGGSKMLLAMRALGGCVRRLGRELARGCRAKLEVEVGEAMLSLGGPEWQNAVLGRDAFTR